MAQKGSGTTPHGRPGDEPGGPRRENPEVYRRRRIVAALAAAVLLALVVVGVVAALAAVLGREDPGTGAEPEATTASAAPTAQEPFADFTPRPRGSASASASPAAEPVEECGSALAVRASTDQESYPEGVEPVLVLTLQNTGTEPCHVNAGTSQMAYVVSSGSDSVFDSRHCQAGAEDREVTLEPQEELGARLTWNRVRTLEGCVEEGGQARPGYYRLVVSLGERSSEPVSFVLE